MGVLCNNYLVGRVRVQLMLVLLVFPYMHKQGVVAARPLLTLILLHSGNFCYKCYNVVDNLESMFV